MAQSSVLKAQKRSQFGSRVSRKLRADGRIPANIQRDGDHIDISIEEREFLTSRRAHVHLYDIDIEGSEETAVVRELQWDTFGDHIIHVEFRKVVRGVAMESDVSISFEGHPATGIVNFLVDHVTISCIPSLIPDSLLIKVDGLNEGDHIKASAVQLPEGVTLICEPEQDVATIVAASRPVVEESEGTEEGADEAEPTDGAEPTEESEPS